jgi:adenine-specific DNA methylase
MIPRDCKRLAEVDFPIAVVSRHAAREKSIRHGHPSTLHLWWARRPLASCRAMLLALLLPDPCDRNCPEEFKEGARALLPKVQGTPGPKDEDLRRALLRFIGDFANWDVAAHPGYLEVGRGLVRAAHPEEPPLVVDPFAGGGSIPLEALRLGCEAFASDLNPVACLILKVLLEDIPRHGPALAEELRRAGKKIKDAAERDLAEFYPADPDGARPIAYLWARTVRCETPGCGAGIPLMRSFWLCKKASRRRALRHRVERTKGRPPRVEFEVFEPGTEREVRDGTVSRAKATCLACNTVLAPERVRAQLRDQRGGADVVFGERGRRAGGARLLAVVTLRPGEQGRHYRLPADRDYEAVRKAMKRLQEVAAKPLPGGLSPVPDELLPPIGTLGFRVQRYGMLQWGDLFTARQRLALVTLAPAEASAGAVAELAAFALSRLADKNASLAVWNQPAEKVEHVFARQALPLVWDFAEASPFSGATGGYDGALDLVAKVAGAWPGSRVGQFQLGDAVMHPLPDETAAVWFTDPPYYDAVPYADLSDFFFVWLRRALPGHPLLRDPSDPNNRLTPKRQEIVQDETKTADSQPKDRAFFEKAMSRAFKEGRRVLREDGIGAVVFAHKTTEGWEALLSGMIRGGCTITGSWPIATERPGRLRSQNSAALATSVHLVCRPRPENAPVGDWAEVVRELPRRVGEWMGRLQMEGVRGADLVFACIGPALEVFSRYQRVETAEGREVGLAEFLEKVWEVVGRAALAQVLGTDEHGAGALEEDARLTALFLWALQSTDGRETEHAGLHHQDDEAGDDEQDEEEEEAARPERKGSSLIFDVVRRFAQPLGIHLPDWEGRIIETEKGVVRLLPVGERARQLFGEDGAEVVVERLEAAGAASAQQLRFPEMNPVQRNPRAAGRGTGPVSVSEDILATRREATTLDRVHAAMLLQGGGRAHALRSLLKAEQDRGPEFLRLANALSALYPRESEEKRLLDAMLLAVPR